jgi:methyl-accepting chemotaxis protein
MALIVGSIAIIKSRNIIKKEASEKLDFMSQVYTNKIDKFLDEAELGVNNLATISGLQFDMNEFIKDPDYILSYNKKMDDIVKLIADNTVGGNAIYIQVSPELSDTVYNIYYADKQREGKFKKLDWDLSSEETALQFEEYKSNFNKWSDVYMNDILNTHVVSYTKPVYVEDKLVALVGTDIDFNLLKKEIESIKIYDSGYLALFNEKFDYLVHPKFTFKDNLGTTENGKLKFIVDEMSTNDHGVIEYEFNGESKIIGYSKLCNGWVLGVAPTIKEIFKSSTEISSFLTVVIGICIIIFSIIGIIVSKSISNPIIQLKDSFEVASKGDLTTRIDIKSEDEVGKAGTSFNEMMENINRLIGKVKYSANTVINSSNSLNKITTQTNDSIGEIALIIDIIANNANKQAESTIKGSLDMKELGDEIQLVVESTHYINRESSQINDLSSDGVKIIKSLVEKTNERDIRANDISEALSDNYKSIQAIGGIVDTVSKIAKQTNLLALNASIEAARVGEKGKGFSVVAEEFGNLANECEQSAKEIRLLIDAVQNKFKKSVFILNDIKEIQDQQNNLITQTDIVFNNIIKRIKKLGSNIKNVQSHTEKKDDYKNNIINSIERISYSSQQVASRTQEVSSSTEEGVALLEEVSLYTQDLNELSQHLQEEINNFILDNE